MRAAKVEAGEAWGSLSTEEKRNLIKKQPTAERVVEQRAATLFRLPLVEQAALSRPKVRVDSGWFYRAEAVPEHTQKLLLCRQRLAWSSACFEEAGLVALLSPDVIEHVMGSFAARSNVRKRTVDEVCWRFLAEEGTTVPVPIDPASHVVFTLDKF
jgi:hypothetical protein